MKLLMTNNEFKLYCIIFCKKFRGKTLGEVIPDIREDFRDTLIEFEEFYFDTFGDATTLNIGSRPDIFSNSFGYLRTDPTNFGELTYRLPTYNFEDII